ncbi:rhodanese-like domain-containing protein [Phaeovulum sp.]|uniref:rhodanese-like domain-containing protein n=1 Tax=Phaeovulum sp. TaxID=2934796 RepID=UPI0035684730
MTNLDSLAAQAVPAHMNEVRISAAAFIEKWQAGGCELLDIRVPAETRAWKMGFGLAIPADQIAERLDELPRDKLLVVACPNSDRSSIVRFYLAAKGYDAVYLMGGLLGLADALKGKTSEALSLEAGA